PELASNGSASMTERNMTSRTFLGRSDELEQITEAALQRGLGRGLESAVVDDLAMPSVEPVIRRSPEIVGNKRNLAVSKLNEIYDALPPRSQLHFERLVRNIWEGGGMRPLKRLGVVFDQWRVLQGRAPR